jgi:hypothetical protein
LLSVHRDEWVKAFKQAFDTTEKSDTSTQLKRLEEEMLSDLKSVKVKKGAIGDTSPTSPMTLPAPLSNKTRRPTVTDMFKDPSVN